MFKNYFKIAWRNLIRNKTLSFINITGLSVSIAFCLVLFFYIRYEQSYDTFQKKKDHLFRLEMSNTFPSADTARKGFFSFLTKNDDVQNQLVFPVIVAANMQNEFPEIKGITRFKDNGDQLVKVNNQTYKEKHFLFADSNFFTTFSFPLLKGNPQNVLSSNNNVVIVFGASVKSIVTTLSTDFIKLVVIALVIASPLAYLIANKWLQNFPYRITISWWLFALAGILVMFIALFTISFQAIKAGMANPVKSLRSE